jgi:hypothetical protein
MVSKRNPMPSSVDKISFKAWFLNKIQKDPRVIAHHYDALLAYFKSLGLSEMEEISKYDKALKLYFGK